MKLTILVGTMTGTAQLVAQELELVWDGDDVEVETLLMDDLDASVFGREGPFLLCTSTYGQGDVPDNSKKLFDDLAAKRPDLSGVRYGVFGLGDSTYAQTFNEIRYFARRPWREADRRARAARCILGRAARREGRGMGGRVARAGARSSGTDRVERTQEETWAQSRASTTQR
ncbi:MAG: flavodoxin domain-containing protein [Proteobacteria bacterium]|nr:flavodoxin domain-containing protein [Pseudomonadota bacterium]